MKKFFYFAVALLGMASCTSEDFAGDQSLKEANENAAISFAFDVPMTTRAEGKAAATKLNNQFIVWGEKNETAGAPAAGNLVFPDYKVTYDDNTAYTTTSNTKDWEYVGLSWTAAEAANITEAATPVTTNVQSIKYWDYAATSYTYTAISALPADISSGKVKVNKLTSGTTVYDKGYEVTLAKDASDNYPSLADLYFADRAYIEKTATYDRTASNQYGGNVQFTFRNTQSQVRVGVYETIPGYKVSAIHFFKQDGTTEYTDGASTPTSAFGAVCPNISATNYTGTLTVTYGNGTNAPLNQPIVSVSGTSATDLILGTNYSTLTTTNNSEKYLGESATTATYDTGDGTYTFVMPQKNITSNLKLKVNYTLYNEITKETITITGKTAEVPAQYLNWKPNFKYTYLFKITDNDLYPITFDAAVIEAENGEVEYITTVSEPCITTYAKGSAVTTNNDYKAGELIYAVVEDGGSLATLSATNMKLYTVTTTDATNFPITEASVAQAIAEYPIMSTAEQAIAKIKFTPTSFTGFGKTVVAKDGTTVTMDANNNVVASFTGAAIAADANAGTDAAPQYYAIEYIKTPATYGNDGGKTYADATAFAAAGTLYTDAACTTEAASWTDGTTYYKKSHVTNVGVYAYKIVKVVP